MESGDCVLVFCHPLNMKIDIKLLLIVFSISPYQIHNYTRGLVCDLVYLTIVGGCVRVGRTVRCVFRRFAAVERLRPCLLTSGACLLYTSASHHRSGAVGGRLVLLGEAVLTRTRTAAARRGHDHMSRSKAPQE